MAETSCAATKQLTPRERRLVIVWRGVALGLVVGCALNSISGYDWVTFYYPQAHIFAPERLLNPLWTYFLLTPIAYLPIKTSYVILSFINVGIIWLGSRLSEVNRFALLLSFPALWILWYGQIDGFVMLGVALGLWPYSVGGRSFWDLPCSCYSSSLTLVARWLSPIFCALRVGAHWQPLGQFYCSR